MADLTEIQTSQSVKVAGANPSTGAEDNYLEVDTNGYVGARTYTAAGLAVDFGQATMANSLPVVISSNQTGINTFLDKTGSGTITALNQTVVATTNGCSTVTFDMSGTFNANVYFQAQNGDGAWSYIYGHLINTINSLDSISTYAFNYIGSVAIPCGGYTQVRLLCSSYTSGTMNVTWNASAGVNSLPVFQSTAANLNATVTQLALTKGTQGSTGVSVQDLKDAGRNQTNYFMAVQIVSTSTDTLMSLTGYKGGAAVGATTTPAVVTAGKTYRINSITIDYTTIVTTPGSVRFSLRCNLSGVVAITSPLVATWEIGEPNGIAPVAGKKNSMTIPFPDGMEFPAAAGIGISMLGLNTVGNAAAVGYGRCTINGYEY